MKPRIAQANRASSPSLRRGEEGYTLVALLALMTILALTMISVAPNVRQQTQREREIDAINHGEEVAEAIRLYVLEKRTLPTSMEQLLEGLPRGTKKLQILRPSAAIDPLSSNGEWKLVRVNDALLTEFQRKVMLYNNGALPPTRDETRVPEVYGQVIKRMSGLINTKSEDEDAEAAPGGEDDSENSAGPFVGVVSRSRRSSVIAYYGIERHDQWVFTPLFRN
ncbi:MAG: type II secretion system protein [Acidobacteria bacterium]|nr:type II secretion system protein [Acidobacteriota bacterium]